jgi:type II secretory pathway component GspD/PulD (secretin)
MIPSGNTLVLGGLVQDDVRKSNTKVPLLGDMPVLGGLFRSDAKSRQKSNLMIFLTPTIVEDKDFQPTPSNYLQTPVPMTDSVEGDWSAWDSGKPKDWKKKNPQPEEVQASGFTAVSAAQTPAQLSGIDLNNSDTQFSGGQ